MNDELQVLGFYSDLVYLSLFTSFILFHYTTKRSTCCTWILSIPKVAASLFKVLLVYLLSDSKLRTFSSVVALKNGDAIPAPSPAPAARSSGCCAGWPSRQCAWGSPFSTLWWEGVMREGDLMGYARHLRDGVHSCRLERIMPSAWLICSFLELCTHEGCMAVLRTAVLNLFADRWQYSKLCVCFSAALPCQCTLSFELEGSQDWWEHRLQVLGASLCSAEIIRGFATGLGVNGIGS